MTVIMSRRTTTAIELANRLWPIKIDLATPLQNAHMWNENIMRKAYVDNVTTYLAGKRLRRAVATPLRSITLENFA